MEKEKKKEKKEKKEKRKKRVIEVSKFSIWKLKKDFSLQPPGDPREQHPGDARQRTSSSKFFFLVNQSKTII